MTVTPVLGLTLMSANMAQKEVVFNEAIVAFDALFRGSVISASLTADPASPALGDCYVIGASPTGLWSGHAYQIAFFYNGWQFVAPPLHLQLYDVATSSFMRYEGPSMHWVTVSSNPQHTPPLVANFTTFTNLNSATLTDRIAGAIPSLHVKPGGSGVNSTLYGVFQAAPGGAFSLVGKVKSTMFGTATGWNGAGIAVYNSAGPKATALWLTASNGPALGAGDWSGAITGGSLYLGTTLADGDYFLHIDYDGTNVNLGISRNGLDIVNVHSVTLASLLGAITAVGIFWGGSTAGIEHDFLHFYVGTLGTSGL